MYVCIYLFIWLIDSFIHSFIYLFDWLIDWLIYIYFISFHFNLFSIYWFLKKKWNKRWSGQGVEQLWPWKTDLKAAVQLLVADGVRDELGHPAGGIHPEAGRAEDEVDVTRVQLPARCAQEQNKIGQAII